MFVTTYRQLVCVGGRYGQAHPTQRIHGVANPTNPMLMGCPPQGVGRQIQLSACHDAAAGEYLGVCSAACCCAHVLVKSVLGKVNQKVPGTVHNTSEHNE